MSVEALNEDLDIIQSLVIPGLDSDLDVIQKLDDEPNDVGGLTAAELKAEFDKAGNIIKGYINDTLLPNISDTVAEAEVRAQAEAERQAAEVARQGAEEERETAEAARVSSTNGIVAQTRVLSDRAAEHAYTAQCYATGPVSASDGFSGLSLSALTQHVESPKRLVQGARYLLTVNGQAAEAVANPVVSALGVVVSSESNTITITNSNDYAVTVSLSRKSNGIASGAEDYADRAETAMEHADVSAHNAQVWAEGGILQAPPGEASIPVTQGGAKQYAEAAQANAVEAERSVSAAGANVTLAQSWAVGGTGTRDGEDADNAKYWAQQAKDSASGDMLKSVYDPQSKAQDIFAYVDAAASSHTTLATIPMGRMRGDVDGDGKITEADALLAVEHISVSCLDDIQLWCADVTDDGNIRTGDCTQIQRYADGSRAYFDNMADYYGNWTYDFELLTFYYDIPVEGMMTTHSAIVTVSGSFEEGHFSATCMDGVLRLYARLCPITEQKCVIQWFTGDGSAVVLKQDQDVSGKQDKPRAVSVTLTVAGWDTAALTQTVAVAGVLEDEAAQLIQPMPALASKTAYHAAGILCTAQAAGELTFTAQSVPTEDLSVYVVIQEVAV